MASYIIDIWKDGELVQSVAGTWTDDEAPPLHVLLSRLLPRRPRAALARAHREQPAGSRRRNPRAGRHRPPASPSCGDFFRACRRSLFPGCRRSCLGTRSLGARQAASTQKDRRGFARRGAKTALLFRFLRTRLTLAHPALGKARVASAECNP